MADRWKDRLARVDRAIDRAMSETLAVFPMLAGDFTAAVADPDREAFEVDGVLTIHRGETDFGGVAEHLRTMQLRTARAEAQIIKTKLPAGAEIRKGDRIVAVDQGLAFAVDRIDTEHPGRLALTLTIDKSVTVTP